MEKITVYCIGRLDSPYMIHVAEQAALRNADLIAVDCIDDIPMQDATFVNESEHGIVVVVGKHDVIPITRQKLIPIEQIQVMTATRPEKQTWKRPYKFHK